MTEPMVDDGATSVDVVEMTVEQVQAAFAGGAVDSASLTKAFLERIATWDPHDTASSS